MYPSIPVDDASSTPNRKTGVGVGRVLVAVLVSWATFTVSQVNAALPDRKAEMQFGFANKATSVDDPMRLVITVKDPANDNKTIERDVAVTDIPKYVAPTPNAGETPRA